MTPSASDQNASALSIDVNHTDTLDQATDNTSVMGIFIDHSSSTPSSGAMIKIRNALDTLKLKREDFIVDGSGNVATGTVQGTPLQARLQVEGYPGSTLDLAQFIDNNGKEAASISETGDLKVAGNLLLTYSNRHPTCTVINGEGYAGTGATATIDGYDSCGVIKIDQKGDAGTKGTWVKVDLSEAAVFNKDPLVLVSPQDPDTAKANFWVKGSFAGSKKDGKGAQFIIGASDPNKNPNPGTQYVLSYLVLG
jgi:hypothetical protein